MLERYYRNEWSDPVYDATCIACCHAIVASGNAALPDEHVWRRCHFCGRKTNLWVSARFSAPHFCPTCLDTLPAWNALSYLTLL
jgi:hypothetical protein